MFQDDGAITADLQVLHHDVLAPCILLLFEPL